MRTGRMCRTRADMPARWAAVAFLATKENPHHGSAPLIEYAGEHILFDPGNNPDILVQNARVKGIDLSKLDFVVMSHRHDTTWEDWPIC